MNRVEKAIVITCGVILATTFYMANVYAQGGLRGATGPDDYDPVNVSGIATRVLDGGRFEFTGEVWPGTLINAIVHVRGIDIPNFDGACEEEGWKAHGAKRELEQLLIPWPVHLEDIKPGPGPNIVIATVIAERDNKVMLHTGVEMVRSGYAKAYGGGERESWCEYEQGE
jgi:hypothetical protein